MSKRHKAIALSPEPGFDWRKVIWGRPDSPRSALCSYCSAVIKDEEIPFIMWSSAGYAAQFCDKCQRQWFRMDSVGKA
jgi:hypothetical protein